MILNYLADLVVKNNSIDNFYYEKEDVKRGLRHKDGKGVIAGLTGIGAVTGLKEENGVMVPDDGILRYRGKSIFKIVDELQPYSKFWYERVIFLLLVGRFPTEQEFKDLQEYFATQRFLPDATLDHVIKGVPSKSVMNKIIMSVASLFANDTDPNSLDPYSNFVKSLSIMAKMPSIVAYSFLSYNRSNPDYLLPPEDFSMAEAFLYMVREGAHFSELEREILDLCLVLHAEHGGGNNSTFACKVVTSSGSDIYSSLCAAVGSLKGPLHGSANEKVMDMMENIKQHVSNWDDPEEIAQYLEKILKKEVYDKSGKIYGLGHAVYTKSDPRAIILKEKARFLAHEKNRLPEFNLYEHIEELGPKIFAKVTNSDKVIAPNVDFYSGFVYDCLEIPVKIYTPIFALARTSGWCAHRIEEILSGKRIIRPGYKYIEIEQS
jgi:citrate synthase